MPNDCLAVAFQFVQPGEVPQCFFISRINFEAADVGLSSFLQPAKLFENDRVIERGFVVLCVDFDAAKIALRRLLQPFGLLEERRECVGPELPCASPRRPARQPLTRVPAGWRCREHQ
jgi:hypothetical protein